ARNLRRARSERGSFARARARRCGFDSRRARALERRISELRARGSPHAARRAPAARAPGVLSARREAPLHAALIAEVPLLRAQGCVAGRMLGPPAGRRLAPVVRSRFESRARSSPYKWSNFSWRWAISSSAFRFT